MTSEQHVSTAPLGPHVHHHGGEAGLDHAAREEGDHDHDHALTDPVCGMPVTTASPHKQAYAGKPYYFCSANCLGKFDKEPQRYALKPDAPQAPVAARPVPTLVAGTAVAIA